MAEALQELVRERVFALRPSWLVGSDQGGNQDVCTPCFLFGCRQQKCIEADARDKCELISANNIWC